MNNNCIYYESTSNGKEVILNLNNVTFVEYDSKEDLTTVSFGTDKHSCYGKSLFEAIKYSYFRNNGEKYTASEDGYARQI